MTSLIYLNVKDRERGMVILGWTVKGEYDYVGASSSSPTTVVPGGRIRFTGDVQTFVAGVNYKF